MKRIYLLVILLLLFYANLASAAIIVRHGNPTTASGSSVTTLSVVIPTAASIGDYCMIQAVSSATGPWGTPPAGFTALVSTDQHTSIPSSIVYSGFITSISQGGSTVVVVPPASSSSGAVVFCYSGVSSAVPVDQAAVTRTASSTIVTAPSLTSLTGATDELVLLYGTVPGTQNACGNGTTPTGPSFWSGGSNICIYDLLLSSSGPTGTYTVTLGTAKANEGTAIALIPTVLPTPTPTATPTPSCVLPNKSPTFTIVSSSATPSIIFPSSASVGALGFICANSSAVGTWGADPVGWSAITGTSLSSAVPSVKCYQKRLVSGDLGASITINAPGSGSNVISAFALGTLGGIDMAAVQHNASGTISTTPGITPTGNNDFLINIYSANPGTSPTFSEQSGFQQLWASDRATAIYYLNLSSNSPSGTSTATMSVSAASSGISIGINQLCVAPGYFPTIGFPS